MSATVWIEGDHCQHIARWHEQGPGQLDTRSRYVPLCGQVPDPIRLSSRHNHHPLCSACNEALSAIVAQTARPSRRPNS